ncbi:DUF4097 family beta strand repeat-containing protein [Alteromonas australica]|uniref:DUF4097 family beta strand repeat-containing protein n=1 Tax=Alteromonas australica TaxID=589873 RepID=UPI0023554179|nr:DUF4097 family beta strand repeat-containing protein [Alteromonas australica]|tara:strand:+ start:1157 stop:2146 length:990 start_codon:yes stop_codon:yes gene_type:complete
MNFYSNCSTYARVLSLSLFTLGLILASTPADAGEKVDRTLDTGSSPKLDIEHVNGKADIQVWDNQQVKVVGELSDRTNEFIFERKGNVVIIHVEVNRLGKKWWENNDEGDDLTIYVPKDSDINYTAVNADVYLEGVTQGANVEVVNGSVSISNTGKRVKAESVNGDITLENVYGRLDAETVNGEIQAAHIGNEMVSFASVNGEIAVTTSSPDVTVETVNGQIDLTLQTVDALSINTVNGYVKSLLTLNPNGRVKASSVGGTINMVFQPGVSAQFDIETHAGGNISNNISSDKPQKPKYGPSSWLRFINNGGEGSVDISTVHGSITIDEK